MPLSRGLLDRLQIALFTQIGAATATAGKANPVPDPFNIWTDLRSQHSEDVGWQLHYCAGSDWRSSGGLNPMVCYDRLVRGLADKTVAIR